MNHERIILELMEKVHNLEDRIEKLEKTQQTILRTESVETNKTYQEDKKVLTSKYRGLTEYLLRLDAQKVRLTFFEIEKIIGFNLPESAKKYRAFWANTETHNYAFSWLLIDYVTTMVDIENKIITFEKVIKV